MKETRNRQRVRCPINLLTSNKFSKCQWRREKRGSSTEMVWRLLRQRTSWTLAESCKLHHIQSNGEDFYARHEHVRISWRKDSVSRWDVRKKLRKNCKGVNIRIEPKRKFSIQLLLYKYIKIYNKVSFLRSKSVLKLSILGSSSNLEMSILCINPLVLYAIY